jgi:hypothetical protein
VGGGVLTVDGSTSNVQYLLKINIKTGEDKFQNSRIVYIYPEFTLMNKTPSVIYCAQYDTSVNGAVGGPPIKERVICLNPGAKSGFHWPDRHKSKAICINKGGIDAYAWSPGFNPLEIGSYSLKMRDKHDSTVELFVKIKIQDTSDTTLIIFEEADMDHPPYIIVNNIDIPFKVFQKSFPNRKYTIYPNGQLKYTWESLMEEEMLGVDFAGEHGTYFLTLNKIRDFKPINLKASRKQIFPSITADGSTRILRFAKRPNPAPAKGTVEMNILLNISGIGVSVINAEPTELLY